MEEEKQRRAYLIRALGTDAPVLHRLEWKMSVDVFITLMVTELAGSGEVTPGKPALCALLEVIREQVSPETYIHIDELIVEVQTQQKLSPIQTPPQLLFDLLLQMGFKQQVRLVKKAIKLHRTGAFLIHGKPNCGQQILVTRLFRLNRQWKNILPITIYMSYNGVGRSIPHLWRQLTLWFALPKDAPPNEVIERVCDCLLTQDVIFIFHTVDYMLPEVLAAWLQEFWEPLVERVEPNFPPTPEGTHLLMFLIDNSGSVCQSNIVLATQYKQPEYPRIPLQLPPVSRFPPGILDDWLDDATAFSDVQMPAGLTSQDLLKNSDNGIPQYVYEEICRQCGHDWEGELAKWLK